MRGDGLRQRRGRDRRRRRADAAERTRRPAGWWLIATLIAVFPANLHMALHPEEFPKVPGGAPALWARLPFQGVFIAWVLGAMGR